MPAGTIRLRLLARDARGHQTSVSERAEVGRVTPQGAERPTAVAGPNRCPGRRCDRQLTTSPDATAPAGSGVGELASSVRVPALTANDAITLAALPLTRSVLPSGDRRASTAPAP